MAPGLFRIIKITFLIAVTLECVIAGGVDFDQCLKDFRTGAFGRIGGTNNSGQPVDAPNATALTYPMCVKVCGSGQVPFDWGTFFQRFSTWLLPWLALMSQLPFGAEDKLDNVESVLLTVGSPTLAGYSLALTVLNTRWIARRFANYSWPNLRNAVRVLTSLQQAPIRVKTDGTLLASLIILPQNDDWWKELVTVWLNYTNSWSMSAISSIAWVVLAYVFTIVDSFAGDITRTIPSNGQGVGSIWIWLLPLVIGWLQVSPKCDRSRLRDAINRVNSMVWVAAPVGKPVLASDKAISLHWLSDDEDVYTDELCTAPLYNYARFFSWTQVVEEVEEVFRATTQRSGVRESVDPAIPWEYTNSDSPHPNNRVGSEFEVEEYSKPLMQRSSPRGELGEDVVSRMVVASMFGLLLLWGTTGAALVVGWFTYTYGLGCRAGSYVTYGVLSTLAWMLLVSSSILAHRARISRKANNDLEKSHAPHRARCHNGRWAIKLRRIGKAIAVFNAIWVVVACLLQFSNVYNRCFCNSSLFSFYDRAYVVIKFDYHDGVGYRNAWMGGVGLAGATVLIFTIFVALFVNPKLPE